MSFSFKLSSGRWHDLENPIAGEIELEDIAFALARICRFGGHLRKDVPAYSVAQHSCHVSDYLFGISRRAAGYGLLHDAHELAVGDWISPFKRYAKTYRRGSMYVPYKRITDMWDAAIFDQFRLGPPSRAEQEQIAEADATMLATEFRDLIEGGLPAEREYLPEPLSMTIRPWPYADAARSFMRRANDLFCLS